MVRKNKKVVKKVKAPVRIDFSGGTTDIKNFCNNYTGYVLNAAIDKYIQGNLIASDNKAGLEYGGNIPTASGLGTSGAMTLVWLALIGKDKNKEKLAEQVYGISKAIGLGEADGKQDQYAAAFGGINLWKFEGNKVTREKVKIKKKIREELEKKLILVYHKPHYAGDANKSMIKNVKKGKNIKEMKKIRDIAKEMKKTLEKGDLDKFVELMNEETKNRKKLAKDVVPKDVEKMIEKAMKNGAKAAKICGSGNGGSILFFGDKNKIRKAFKNTIEFKFDFEGLQYL